MFKQLNRWLIAWPLVALLFVAGCGEENTRDRNPLAQVKSTLP